MFRLLLGQLRVAVVATGTTDGTLLDTGVRTIRSGGACTDSIILLVSLTFGGSMYSPGKAIDTERNLGSKSIS